MGILTSIRKEKFKDCIFIEKYYVGKKKMHACGNIYSDRYLKHITLNDYICDSWSLTYQND